jgi:hypothetical protein
MIAQMIELRKRIGRQPKFDLAARCAIRLLDAMLSISASERFGKDLTFRLACGLLSRRSV